MKSLKIVRESLALLRPRDRKLLGLAAIAEILLSLLDLAAVLMMGVITALAASEFAATPQSSLLNRFGVPSLNVVQLATLAALVGLALIAKSGFSLWLTRRIYRFVANRQATVASELAQKLLTRPLLEIRRRSSQETAFALSAGVNAATVDTLGPAMVIVAEASLTIALLLALLLVDPLVAVFTVVFFGGIGILLQLLLGSWANELGSRKRVAEVESTAIIQDAMKAYREITVSGRRGLFASKFGRRRWGAASVQADLFILSQAGKYVFEVALVVGGAILVVLLAYTRDVVSALAVLTVFLLATSRLFPSLLRLQTAFSTIRQSSGLSAETFTLVKELKSESIDELTRLELESETAAFSLAIQGGYPRFSADVVLNEVSLTYPGTVRPTLDHVTLRAPAGSSLAVVGPTGAGKTTLADCIMGILNPTAGFITVSGREPRAAVAEWPGSMAYVPQEITLVNGSVRDNVALGLAVEDLDDELIWEALDRSHLAEYLAAAREGLDTRVGEDGLSLSGGQRQRLGIARALYSRPRLLVLDEATSALDAETERLVTETFTALSGEVTRIVIAHRLATVRLCDRVVYLDAGRILASGSFEEVRQSVPDFDHQANLSGLTS